jgi:hypothetical protein
MVPVHLVRRLAVVAAFGLLAAPTLRAQSKTVWHHQFPTKILDARVFFSSGHLGVLTEEGLSALAADDGSEVWQVPRAYGLATQAFTHLDVVWQPDSVALIELDHGNRVWSLKRSLQIDSLAWVQFLPDRNLLLGWGFTGDSGFSIAGASLDAGELLWRQDTLCRGVPQLRKNWKELAVTEWQPIMLDTDSTVVIFPRRGGVMRLDSRTGALLWRVDTLAATEPPFVRGGYARTDFDTTRGVVLVPFHQRVMAVRGSDGKILWTRAAKFPSRLADIRVTPHGYLVRGYFKQDKPSTHVKPFVDLLDPTTGQSRWAKPHTEIDDASVMTVQGYYAPDPKPVADPRYARALWAQRFVYILTGAKDSTGTKGFSVVQLDKTTGAEAGRIWVNDRSPDYRIDPAGGMLYLFTDERTVEALRF